MRHGRGRGRRMQRGGPRRIARFIEPAMLLLLRSAPTHGYGLMAGLDEMGFGEYPVDYSAVYRTLRSLEERGMVRSSWDLEVTSGPPRRVYTITPAGEDHLASWVTELEATDRVLHSFLEAYNAWGAGEESGSSLGEEPA